MTIRTLRFAAPVAILILGAAFTVGVDVQQVMPLRAPLDQVVPRSLEGLESSDVEVTEEEQQVAGMDDYLLRAYHRPGASTAAAAFTVYVGYYEQQTQGSTIHSPKNCLPGAGWEALQSERVTIAGPHGPMVVNKYLLQRDEQRALVFYWYQGRGRTEANEYVVKAHLLRDAALRGRTEEALVRVVVPVGGSVDHATDLAAQVAREVSGSLEAALPSI